MATTHQGRTGVRRGGVLLKGVGALLVLAALGGTGLAIWPRAGRGAAPLTADIATVSKISFDITATASGDLQAKKQIELKSELETESSIAELVAEGTFVHAGDLVVRLNSDQIQSQLDDADLRVASAKSDFVAAEKGYDIQQSDNESKVRQARLKLELAELALDQWDKGEKVQKLKDIELALDKTEKDLARLEEKFESSKKLFSQGFLAKNDLDLDEIALREAKAARAKAKLEEETYTKYQLLKDRKQKTSDVEEARAELDRTSRQAEIQLAIKDADKFNKKQQLARHEEKLEKLKKQLAACTIKAPQDGLVVYATSAGRNWFDDSPFTVGRKIHPQEMLIVLPDTSEMIAAVRVPETLAGRIQEGQIATVKIDAAAGRTFTGKVESIAVMADNQSRWMDPSRREYTVKIALGQVDGEARLKPSMRCEATITLGRVDDAVTVPIQAVFSDEMVRFVYVPRAGKYARVPVKVGRRSETLAELSVGISPGERVLVREPAAGEVLREPWEPSALKLVGFEVGADGKPAPIGGGPGAEKAMAMGAPGGPPSPPGKPGESVLVSGKAGPGDKEAKTAAAAPADKPSDGKPADGKPSAPQPEKTQAKAPDAKPAETKTPDPPATKAAESTDAKQPIGG